MNDPRLGFGWNDVAFSGSSPPARTTSDHQVELDRGQQGGRDLARLHLVQGAGERMRIADLRGSPGEAGEQRRLDELDDRVPRRHLEPDRRPGLAVGEDQRVRSERRHRGLAVLEPASPPRRPRSRPSTRSSSRTPWRSRWIAPRNSGVSSWSMTITRPSRWVGPGSRSCSATEAAYRWCPSATRSRAPARAVPMVRCWSASRMAQTRCCCPAWSTYSRSGVAGADLPAHLAHGGGAAVHEQDRRRVEPHRAHPGRELVDLLRVHALVGEDLALLGRRGEPREVEACRRVRGR